MLNCKDAASENRVTHIRRAAAFIVTVGLVLLSLCLTVIAVEAKRSTNPLQQGQFHWSTPLQIPNYYDLLRAPLLVADREHTIHAFDVMTDGLQDFTILYRTWSKEQGWSLPSDIIIPTYGGSAPTLEGVILDDEGFFHLIYFGGDTLEGNIYYTFAHISQSINARGWSEPVPITSYALRDATAEIIGIEDGKIVVIFAGERYNTGLYEVHSTDGGASWSASRLLSRSKSENIFPFSVWLEMDTEGRIHVVWHMVNVEGVGTEIRYANIDADLIAWQDETVIASRDSEEDALGWPSIISRQDNLILVYQDGFPPTRWVVYSKDSGTTWSNPIRPFPHRGGYEVAYLLKDSAGVIHLVLGNRLQEPEISGMWYSRLVGEQWLPLSPIITGQREGFGPCCPQAVITQGNVLLATWPHNAPREFLTGAWYSYAELDSPELPITEAPGIVTVTEQIEIPESNINLPQLTVSPTMQPTSIPHRDSQTRTTSFSYPLYIGLLPLVLGIGLLIILRRISYREAKINRVSNSHQEDTNRNDS